MKTYSLEERRKWYKTLPKKHIGVGLILRNELGQILILQTNYLGGKWTFPAGGAEQYESPQETIQREVLEEIGIEVGVGRLLFLETVNHKEIKEDNLVLYFDGGILNQSQIEKITLTEEETIDFGFFDISDLEDMLEPHVKARLPYLLKALGQDQPIFMKVER